ncbi:MAG TPA: ATP-dependent DNA helicase RecG [Acidimicrobiia bacterium]|nr:ATP-dependent DNA helicase RecG [Acidimicrobiia bacterium]
MASLARLAEIKIEEVSGVGNGRGSSLRRAGIKTVADLVAWFPRRYIDRTRHEELALLPVDEEVTAVGKVQKTSIRRPRRGLVIVESTITDGTGSVSLVFFNQDFRYRQLSEGAEIAASGKIQRFKGKLRMSSPTVDVLDRPIEGLATGRLVPIYPGVKGVKAGYLRRWIHNSLRRSSPMSDPIPEAIRAELGLVDREEAYNHIHFPVEPNDVDNARRRLIFDELFRLELALALQKRRQIAESRGRAHGVGGALAERFLAGLPYALTEAQWRVLAEIRSDLQAPHAMHRLLQGEVGSGKTVVAVAAMLEAVSGGSQAAVMAPTEVLAGQHFLGIRSLLERAGLSPGEESEIRLGMESLFADPSSDLPVRIALLTSAQVRTNYDPGSTRLETLEAIASGKVDLVIGTHALIQEGVAFRDLAVAVVDEQHRFGVGQRVLLKDKATEADPDLLIMTATPIPRTLSITLYGDLDVSHLDEMPPGRSAVATTVLPKTRQPDAWHVVREEVAAGRQAFVVCPLVEESEKMELASATAEFSRLSKVFSDLRVGLIHGQLPSVDKEAVMSAFRRGQIDVLVSTTVIEVGIDVPNATVMVIEDADRFGLSQLHQLRGRVGRGEHPGRCILISDPTTPEGKARIAAMADTNDGFRLAEIDLTLRGQGTVFGARQSGMVDLKLADIIRDHRELFVARREAFALVDRDPDLSHHDEMREEIRALLGEKAEWLLKS